MCIFFKRLCCTRDPLDGSLVVHIHKAYAWRILIKGPLFPYFNHRGQGRQARPWHVGSMHLHPGNCAFIFCAVKDQESFAVFFYCIAPTDP